ncbi:MAG: luciferase family protein [Bacteroidota bacterium]
MKSRAYLTIAMLALLTLGLPSSTISNIEREATMEQANTLSSLPSRKGGRPMTTDTNPHTQLDQQPEDLTHIYALTDWAFDLQHIHREPSAVSVPGAIAMCMDEGHTCQSCNAFMIGTEFAHFHPHPDYSLHLGLAKADAEVVIAKGWAEWHPLIKRGILPPNIVMLYAPRDQEELDAAKSILQRSYDYARGKLE